MLFVGSCKVILLDIEGTTTPINFVHQTLFPFASEKLADYLSKHAQSADLKNDLVTLRDEYEEDFAKSLTDVIWNPSNNFFDALPYLNFLTSKDRKSTALKSIQGKIWEEGYQSGALKGAIFEDVPIAFQQWHEQGMKLYIFSSGSVLAQKLIFRYSTAGDLTKYISGYFDTTTGRKREAKSYQKIAEQIGDKPQNILFISDIPEELTVAHESGMQIKLSIRPGNLPLTNAQHFEQIHSFL